MQNTKSANKKSSMTIIAKQKAQMTKWATDKKCKWQKVQMTKRENSRNQKSNIPNITNSIIAQFFPKFSTVHIISYSNYLFADEKHI